MIISVFMMLIAASCLIQPNPPRLFAAIVFSGLIIVHDLYFAAADGLKYYGSAALTALAIMTIISGISPPPPMVVKLQLVCIASIVINAVGWVMWLTYFPPLAYNNLMVIFYITALLVLTKRDDQDVGGFTVDGWLSCFRLNIFTGAISTNKNGNEK